MKPILHLLSLCLLCLPWFAQAAETRPNFLIIIADDLCWRDLGYEGSPDVKTPNLDKLRSESMHLKGMLILRRAARPHGMRFTLASIRSAAGRIRITLASMMELRACSHI